MPRTSKEARLDWLKASSSLRMLLNYPDTTERSIDRFRIYNMRGTDYIYNMVAGNIIATRRALDGKRTLLRYRPASYYANILRDYGERRKFIVIPSTNVGRQQRRIARGVREIGENDRLYILSRLHRSLRLGSNVQMREIAGLEQPIRLETPPERHNIIYEPQMPPVAWHQAQTIDYGTATWTSGTISNTGLLEYQQAYQEAAAASSQNALNELHNLDRQLEQRPSLTPFMVDETDEGI